MASNHSYKNKLGVQQPIVLKKKSANKFDAELCQTFYNLELQFPWEVTKHIIGDELVYRKISPGNFRTTNFMSTVQNYRDEIMQIFTMRYNLEFRKLTLYGITRSQSIKKSKQISGKTILSSPQDIELNLNFTKNRDITVVTRSVTLAVLTTDTL